MLYSGIDLHKRSLVIHTLDTEQRWHGNRPLGNAGERRPKLGSRAMRRSVCRRLTPRVELQANQIERGRRPHNPQIA